MNSTTTCQNYDLLFLLDFTARYAVDRCGADDTVSTAIMSTMCLLPLYAWVTVQIVTIIRPDLYMIMHSIGLSTLTILQIALLYIFSQPPPITMCGPKKAFPCPQVTLMAFFVTTYFCYAKDFDPQNYKHVYINFVSVLVLQWVCISTVTIGFATPQATIVGTLLGCCIGCSLHESLIFVANEKPEWQGKLLDFFKFMFGEIPEDEMIVKFKSFKENFEMPQATIEEDNIKFELLQTQSQNMGE